jgi:hypothetical protein
MTSFQFTSVDVPAAVGTYTYIGVTGVDAAERVNDSKTAVQMLFPWARLFASTSRLPTPGGSDGYLLMPSKAQLDWQRAYSPATEFG